MSATQMRHQARGLAVLALLGLLAGVGMQATAPPAEATFPGRNGLIFFHSNRVTLDNIPGDLEIFSMRPDGSRLRQVTNNRRVADGQPSVSADGSTVAFVRRLPNSSSAIFVMHADGSGQTRVTHSPFEESAASISPDGTHIAFVRDDFFKQIFSIAVNGSSETQLTFDAEGSSDNPAWSPDGTQIAFDRDPPEPGHQYYIFTMDADGGHQMRRTAPSQNPEFWEEDPSWSPDGSQLAFVGYGATAGNPEGEWEVYVASLAALRDNIPTQMTSNAVGEFEPAWSPDGTRIVFTRPLPGSNNYELFVIRADGSGETRLTHDPREDASPDWQARP